jgi:DNA-binding NtrC family response regulator
MSHSTNTTLTRVLPAKIAYVPGSPTTLRLRKFKIVIEDSERPAEFIFDQESISLGAMEDNDIVLDDETVSRYHARIAQEGDDYVIEDLDSTNGTQVNRVRVRSAYLRPGCVVTLGKTDVRFHVLDEEITITPSNREAFGDIVGRSVAIREIFNILEKISSTNTTVIIEGETGTGKEVVAKTLHRFSHRKDQPFIVFDCGAVPKELIESELFGHEKGSFTGAVQSRQGLFEMAQRGTLFLDELGELSLDLQPKLLRALEQREIRRVGSNKPIKVDVRVIAATNRNLADEVAAGRFREDLYYRLSVVRLMLPALRERKEDIPLLVKHFLKNGSFNRTPDDRTKVKGMSRDALDALVGYQWPGNVRELLNVIERACSFAEEEYVHVEDLPAHITGLDTIRRRSSADLTTMEKQPPRAPLDRAFKDAKEEWIAAFERDYIAGLLKKHNHNISHAAREADIDRKYFRKLMKKYELDGAED